MVDKGDFQKIIYDYMKIHNINEETKIEITQWDMKRDIYLYEVPDILGSIPDSFLKVEISHELTVALYYPPDHFLERLVHFSNLAYSGDFSKA